MIVQIRQANVADVRKVTDLCASHAAYERVGFDPAGHSDRLASAMMGTPPRVIVLLAEQDERQIGYASLSREFSTWRGRDFMHMDCLFVVEAMRGRGVGRKLFNAVLEEARRLGLDLVEWQTPEWNDQAILFYRGLGAVDRPKARFSIRSD